MRNLYSPGRWLERVERAARRVPGRPAISASRPAATNGAAPDRPRPRSLVPAHPELAANGTVEIMTIRTTDDRGLAETAGKGLFIKEIKEAVIAGHIDLGVPRRPSAYMTN
jgi:hypothetical protein